MPFTEFYCQTTGSNLNAGSETTDAARLTYVSGSWVASTGVFTVASGNPVTDGVVVGDFASVYTDGATVTGFVGRVTARDATTITVSLTAKSGTAPVDGTSNRTLKIGGAWKGPNAGEDFPFGFFQSSQNDGTNLVPRVNFKSGTDYAVTNSVSHTTVTDSNPAVWQGYTTTPGDRGRAVLTANVGGASFTHTFGSTTSKAMILADWEFHHNGSTGSTSCVTFASVGGVIMRCVAHTTRGAGFSVTGAGTTMIECEAYGCNASNTADVPGIFTACNGRFIRCISHHNAQAGFSTGTGSSFNPTIIGCIAHANPGAGFMFRGNTGTAGIGIAMYGCSAYDNGADGLEFDGVGNHTAIIENCSFVANGGYGINQTDAEDHTVFMRNNGFGAGTMANASGQVNLPNCYVDESGRVTFPTDVTPWADPDDGDFSIILDEAKGAGYGTYFQTQSGYGSPNPTVGYPDIGAAEAQHSVGGGPLVGSRLIT